MWQSGFAGSIVSMASYVLGGVYLLKLLQKMKFSRTAVIFAFSIYALNPNILFMQTLAMTETLLIFLAIASCYYLYLWSIEYKYKDLVFGALFVFLSTLTRYDGWFLFLIIGLYVGYKRKI
jgi:4-amino-4-deoxy-L-arabinose transferase-like glycosyltransferase